MKTKLRRIVAIVLALFAFGFILTACNDAGQGDGSKQKLTEAFIKSELSNSEGALDGILTIEKGTSDDVTAFHYVVSDINASKLTDKSYTRKAVTTLLSNPGNITYGELMVCSAFQAAMQIIGIFYGDENFDSSAYTEEILSIICDGTEKTYNGWTVSAEVDQAADSITVKASLGN